MANSSLSGKEFRIISIDDFQHLEALRFKGNNSLQKAYLQKYYPNTTYTVPKSNIVHFFGVYSDTKKTSRNPILTIPFNNQNENTIVLLERNKSSTEQIQYSLISNDSKSFPELTAAIFNKSNKPVILKLENDIIKISPNSIKYVPLPVNKGDFFDGKVVFATQRANKSIDYFYSAFWRVYKGSKKLCFINMDESQDKLKLKVIPL
jgi:hypothetical protein